MCGLALPADWGGGWEEGLGSGLGDLGVELKGGSLFLCSTAAQPLEGDLATFPQTPRVWHIAGAQNLNE